MTHGGAPAGWLEFSANLNPTGVPAAVAAAVSAAAYETYADLDPRAAELHLATDAGVAADSVLLTAGATEAIRLVASALVPRGDAVIIGPTYSEYVRAARQAGIHVVGVQAEPPAFDPPLEAALAHLVGATDLVFVCDPNNPTGRALGPQRLRLLLAAMPHRVTLVLDQSFGPFASETLGAADGIASGNVVLVRSLTKSLAVPGLRVGYVIAAPRIIETLRAHQDPWAVAAHAIAAATVASWTLPAQTRDRVVAWRDRLIGGLVALGLRPLPSEANFVLVHVGPVAAVLVEALAARRIAVRSCASFGLPEHLRIAVRPPAEQDLLLGALAAIAGDAG